MANAADVDGFSEPSLLPPGWRFGNYVIHECIGQGAMGNVYRAEHVLLEKPVALKVMDASLLMNADARARFVREGQAAAAIKHPNVVDITDVGVFQGTPYLVMELLVGEDLQGYIERRKFLSEREIASILIPVTAALGIAHDRGVIHRDLKPSNIFLSRGPDDEIVPKVLDFGISKIGDAVASKDFEATPFNQLLGSPLYLPPEAVHGSRALTVKSDQYSIGVVLYECVTGRPPFVGDSLMTLLNAISAGDYVRPNRLRPDLSVSMEHAIQRALNPDPALRFEHIRDLGAALLEVAGMRTQMLWGRTFGRIDLAEPPFSPRNTAPMVLMHRPGVTHRLPRKRAHHRLWLALVSLAAVGLPTYWALETPPLEVEAPAALVSQLSRHPERAATAGPYASSSAYDAPEPADVPLAASPEPGAPRAELEGRAAAPERVKPARRPRPAAASVEPRSRAALLPEVPGRSGHGRNAERRGDELEDLFSEPGPAADGTERLLPIGSVGANDSPILD